MTDAPNPDFDAHAAPPAPPSAVSPLYWSVRRELWEHRVIVVAPLVVAATVLVGFLFSTIGLPGRVREAAAGASGSGLLTPYSFLAMALIVIGFVVGGFYALAALHGERRDRGMLFWKSMPVSDLTTVASKALIPLAVLPGVIWAVTVATHLVMLLIASVIVLAGAQSVGALWSHLPLARIWLILAYGLLTTALWHAPIYSWFLLVSGWARRTPFLWALAPPFVLVVVEHLAFKGSAIRLWLADRVTGASSAAFSQATQGGKGLDRLPQLDPVKFLSTPGLWIGLILAGIFLAVAVRQRRRREPI